MTRNEFFDSLERDFGHLSPREHILASKAYGANYVYKEASEIIQNLLSVCNENNLPVVELYGSPSIIQDAKAFLAEGIEDACKRIDSRG